MAREFDSPWKETLDEWFEPSVQLFWPDIHAEIDWSLGYRSLDKELQEIVREAELGVTVGDKLFEVTLATGIRIQVLVHVEVQSQPDGGFPERMFVYYYRIRDRYNQDVASLAILGDERPGWNPTEYTRAVLGCEIRFRFRTVKLLSWVGREAELLNHPNPVALIVLAHLESIATHGSPELRRDAKWNLIRQLYFRGLKPEQVRRLYRMIDWLLELPIELQKRLREDVYSFEQEQRMPYITSTERLARAEGIDEGRKEGRKEGIDEGRKEGLFVGIRIALRLRFGDAGNAILEEIQMIQDPTRLQAILDGIPSATLPEELRPLIHPSE